MIKLKTKEKCCGCGACEQACAKSCITMVEDKEGFLYPQVNSDACVDCHLCEKVCPVINVKENKIPEDTLTYAAYNNSMTQRMSASSGGIFELLAKKMLEEGGHVYGAVFDDEFNVVHSCASNLDELEPLKRSKYVQSEIGDSYAIIKKRLANGENVLFVGTPCQVAGLKSFLRKEYDNLITIDVVCHGVPSPLVWRKYLTEIKYEFAAKFGSANINKVKINEISFRDKVESWRRFHLSIKMVFMKDGIDATGADSMSETYSRYVWEDPYMLSFLNDYALRPSCYSCSFRNGKCKSDISLADFWRINEHTNDARWNGTEGTSVVHLHTEKGIKYFSDIECAKSKYKFIQGYNAAMLYDWPKPYGRTIFFKKLLFHSVEDTFRSVQKMNRVFNPIYSIYRKIIRKWQKLV